MEQWEALHRKENWVVKPFFIFHKDHQLLQENQYILLILWRKRKSTEYCLIFSFDWGLRHGHISLLPANPRNTHILTFSLYIAFNIGIKEIWWCIIIRTPVGTTRWTVVVNCCQEGGTWKLDWTEFKFTAQLLPQSSYKVCCLISASFSCYILRPTDKHAGAKKVLPNIKLLHPTSTTTEKRMHMANTLYHH
jgi:hypothetical protein